MNMSKKTFSIKQACQVVCGVFYGPAELQEQQITGVVIDNRKAEPGNLFVPIIGERFDGHDFIPAAFEAGAICCLSQKEVPFAHIRVQDTLQAFQVLAGFYKSLYSVKAIGITGSVGKTTTKEMLYSVLSQRFAVMKSLGNLNNQTGVPQTLFRISNEDEIAIVEMGTNHFGEIESLAKMVRPDFCVYTNIGDSHIEHLGSREGILRAKCEMLPYMQPDGRVFFNADDPLLATIPQKNIPCTSYGLASCADVYAKDVRECGLDGTDFIACCGDLEFPVHVPAPGKHMVQNALCAIAVGLALCMDTHSLQAGVAAYTPLAGRMLIEHTEHLTILNDVYNANPSSVKASIDVLAAAPGRKVCILGDMLELGEHAAEYHAETGAYAAQKGIDLVLCVGRLSVHTAAAAQKQGAEAQYFATQNELKPLLAQALREGDTVLVKASRGMALEKTAEALKKLVF